MQTVTKAIFAVWFKGGGVLGQLASISFVSSFYTVNFLLKIAYDWIQTVVLLHWKLSTVTSKLEYFKFVSKNVYFLR